MTTTGLFKKAENLQGFLKTGVMGFPGSGKSFTSAQLAIGLVKHIGDKRPVFALDTEKGFEYLVEVFTKAGVELQLARTRAFVDLLAAIDEAEANGSVLIIDSITHFWEEVQEAYKKKHNKTSFTMRDWGPIKSMWKQYTEKYLNSKLHIIMCGRAADTFEFFTDEDGKKQIEKTGTKMQAEKNLGYEPGLAIEMERVSLGEFKKGQRNFVNRAYILKDRFDLLDGQYFDNPTFETFLPHVQKLNLGKHAALSDKKSDTVFGKNSDFDHYERSKQIEILQEEIMGELTSAFPGRSSDEVKSKTDILYETLRTRSWAATQDMDPKVLKKGLESIRAKLKAAKNGGKTKEGSHV